MSDLKRQGIRAFIWDFSGKLATQGAGFIVTIFLARLLEPADFGLIAMIMVIIGMASVFSDVGLGSALIQRKRVLPIHYASVFYFNFLIALLLTILCFISADWIATFYQNLDLIPLIEVMSLSFFINAFGSVQATKLRKELNYKALTKAGFLSSLIGGITGIALAFNRFGVWSLVCQSLCTGIFSSILLWSFSRWQPEWKFSFKALMQLWKYGFRIFLSGLLDAIYTRLDYMLIGKLFMPATLGYFQRAKSLNLLVIQYSSGSLMSILFPLLSQIKNDLGRFRRVVIAALSAICFIVFLLLGEVYLLSESLIVVLFGKNWLPSVGYFQILVFSGFAYPISALLVNVLSSRGRSKEFLRLEIYKKIILSINLVVLYLSGIENYLIGLIITSIIGVYFNTSFVAREIDLKSFVLFEPMIDQAVIAVLSAVLTVNISEVILISSDLLVYIKCILFLSIYVMFSKMFRTRPYQLIAKHRDFKELIIDVKRLKNLAL